MTALEMFRRFGITQQAYENFLKPTLLVRRQALAGWQAGRRPAMGVTWPPGVGAHRGCRT